MSFVETISHVNIDHLRLPFLNSRPREYGPRLSREQRETIEIDETIYKRTGQIAYKYKKLLRDYFPKPNETLTSIDQDFEDQLFKINLDIIQKGFTRSDELIARDNLSIAAHGAYALCEAAGMNPDIANHMRVEGRRLLIQGGVKYKRYSSGELDLNSLREYGLKVMTRTFSMKDVHEYIYYPKVAEKQETL